MTTQTILEKRRNMERAYEQISPFELKNKLISLAQENEKKSTRVMLDAGRGNPNWIAATPRQAFFTLGQFAVEESYRVWRDGDLGGKPHGGGIARRLASYLDQRPEMPGTDILKRVVAYGVAELKFEPNAWVHELVDGIIGDNYPTPDRMLVHVEQIVHQFLVQELCQNGSDTGPFELFAVEGATAAMCYIFDTLQANFLLQKGDKIGVMVPIFPPYVEIPHLKRYDFDVVEIRAKGRNPDGSHTWQYPAEELDKLRDPAVKALFLVNPSNPPSVAIDPEGTRQLMQIVKMDRPDLMIITDDVYGTFVDDYWSLMADLPYHTISVYSMSKYFGVTGWRLGVIALHEKNVFDELLAGLPAERKDQLARRYGSLSHHVDDLRFMERLVADSREVALNHTAGLSTPQQVQMALFAGFALTDKGDRYKRLTKDICRRRMKVLYEGLGLDVPQVKYGAYYYTQFDLSDWARNQYGDAFVQYLQANYEPVDVLFALAQQSSIVLLNGGGFYGPPWSVRVSLANLDDDAYGQIGQVLHQSLEQYAQEWKKH